jgi:hypothetical protein
VVILAIEIAIPVTLGIVYRSVEAGIFGLCGVGVVSGIVATVMIARRGSLAQ